MMSYVIHVELLKPTFYNYKIFIKLVIIIYFCRFPRYYLLFNNIVYFFHMFMFLLFLKIVIIKKLKKIVKLK